jgi:hypothetical protein
MHESNFLASSALDHTCEVSPHEMANAIRADRFLDLPAYVVPPIGMSFSPKCKSVFKKSYAWTCYGRCDDH